MYRAERLLVRRVLYGMRPAEAWRFVNSKSKSNDNSAAEMTRRELQWYERNKEDLSRRFGRFADVSRLLPGTIRRETSPAVRPRR